MAKFFIHLLARDDAGPVRSGTGGTAFPIGSNARYRIACQPRLAMDGMTHRGTTEPWAVCCDACKATEDFRAIDRPHPRETGRGAGEDLVADGRP